MPDRRPRSPPGVPPEPGRPPRRRGEGRPRQPRRVHRRPRRPRPRPGRRKAADAAPALRSGPRPLADGLGGEARPTPETSRTRTRTRPGRRTRLTTPAVRTLVWAGRPAGRGRAGPSPRSPRPGPMTRIFRPIRREAVLALASKASDPRVAQGPGSRPRLAGDPETRAIAAQALARLDPERAGALGRAAPDRRGRLPPARLEGKVRVR